METTVFLWKTEINILKSIHVLAEGLLDIFKWAIIWVDLGLQVEHSSECAFEVLDSKQGHSSSQFQ